MSTQAKEFYSGFVKKQMKFFVLSFLAIGIVSSAIFLQVRQNNKVEAAAVKPAGQTSGWNMIFSDEFDSSQLDTTKWTPGWFGTGITGPVNTAEDTCYDSNQVQLPGDGKLHLKLIASPNPNQNVCGGSARPHIGSLVSSNGKFQFSYGYVEFRVFIPADPTGMIANWPAVWTNGQSWPYDGENDVMEGKSGKACHYFIFNPPQNPPGGCVTSNFTGWHTFGSLWEAGKVTYYYDSVQVGQITTAEITAGPHYLIMNNTQGEYGGQTVVPSDMLVDYVRVWEKCTTNCLNPAKQATDFDGNGTSDIAVFRPSVGQWLIKDGATNWLGLNGDIPVPGDYDGNGTSDIAVFRPSNGGWYIKNAAPVFWGLNNDIPVPGDYNGDGKTDVAVYRPSTGQWLVQNMQTVSWGLPGDKPVPGDYDNNGITNRAVFRPSTGQWLIKDGSTTSFGLNGDIPVPGDYNGDGKTDIAVFRPSSGQWHVINNAAVSWGQSGDIPVRGDFDGDGKTDKAVFRPSNNTWYILDVATVQWGLTNDVPLIANPYPYYSP